MYIPIAYGSGLGKGGIIAVSIDSGSTVTVQLSTGGKTYSAQAANGQAVLSGLPVGTYSVTATLGEQSATAQAVIEHDGQVVSLAMSYSLVLFAAGQGLTAGYSVSSYITANVNTQRIRLEETVRACLIPAVDVTEYSSLHITYSAKFSATPNGPGRVGLQDTDQYLNYDAYKNNFAASTKLVNNAVNQSVAIDLNAISGAKYIAIHQFDAYEVELTHIELS